MNNLNFQLFANDFVKIIKKLAPYRTGNLRNNSVQFFFEDGKIKKAVIYVNEDIAPYMPFTNEPWTASRWNGKQNPNEGWWDDSIEIAIRKLCNKFGGTYRKE